MTKPTKFPNGKYKPGDVGHTRDGEELTVVKVTDVYAYLSNLSVKFEGEQVIWGKLRHDDQGNVSDIEMWGGLGRC